MHGNHDFLTPKTLAELKVAQMNSLVRAIESNIKSDWENIVYTFDECFDISEKNQIEKQINSPNFNAARVILDNLKSHRVPISRLYDCCVENQLKEACYFMEKEFPEETSQFSNKGLIDSVSNNQVMRQQANFSQVPEQTKTTQFKQQLQSLQVPVQSQESYQQQSAPAGLAPNTSTMLTASTNSTSSGSGQQVYSQLFTPASPPAAQTIISIFEEILPVMHDEKSIKLTDYQNNMQMNFKIYGKFDVCYINDRKLTFKKREFFDPYDYIRELKMIKNRHLNLYTAECIYKNPSIKGMYLLYNHSSAQTLILTEYAHQYSSTTQPCQYNTLNQLMIMRDIACGLSYLHNKTENKKASILHGNLHSDNILIEFQGKDLVSAKLYDFVNTIDITDNPESYEANIRDEFFRFGMILFLITTWKFLSRFECENLHKHTFDDINLYLYQIFRKYEIDKQFHEFYKINMIKLSYRFTSPSYDIYKGLNNNKMYSFMNDLIDRFNNESKWPSSN